MAKIIGYRATLECDLGDIRRFKTRDGAERFLAAAKSRLIASNDLCDNDIWTSIELIYETRWDCPTARPAAAFSVHNL